MIVQHDDQMNVIQAISGHPLEYAEVMRRQQPQFGWAEHHEALPHWEVAVLPREDGHVLVVPRLKHEVTCPTEVRAGEEFLVGGVPAGATLWLNGESFPVTDDEGVHLTLRVPGHYVLRVTHRLWTDARVEILCN